MANSWQSPWQRLFNVVDAVNRFRINGEAVRRARFELAETHRLAMNAECANRPSDAHSRQYCEGKLWPAIPGAHLFE